MSAIIKMPAHVKECIDFALYPLGITPHHGSYSTLKYELEYETGLALAVVVACVERRMLLIFKQPPAIRISVLKEGGLLRRRKHYLTRYLQLNRTGFAGGCLV